MIWWWGRRGLFRPSRPLAELPVCDIASQPCRFRTSQERDFRARTWPSPDLRPPMSAPLKAIDGTADLPALMIDLAAQARAAARVLALAPPEQKDRALEAIERAIRANSATILAANAEDVAEVRAGGATSAFIDRLTL